MAVLGLKRYYVLVRTGYSCPVCGDHKACGVGCTVWLTGVPNPQTGAYKYAYSYFRSTLGRAIRGRSVRLLDTSRLPPKRCRADAETR